MPDEITATVTYVDRLDGSELIEVSGHRLQFGGVGDGYCYEHQSFDCVEGLSAEERRAVEFAEFNDGT